MNKYQGAHALSLHQPLATLLVYGLKLYETRDFYIPHYACPRRVIIHAAKRWTEAEKVFCMTREVSEALERIKPQLDEQLAALHAAEVKAGGALSMKRAKVVLRNNEVVYLPLGAYVGAVEVVRCHFTESMDTPTDVLENLLSNFGPNRWAWQISERAALRYVAAVGRQRWWRNVDELEEVKA